MRRAPRPHDAEHALLAGRLWRPGIGPAVVALHSGQNLIDQSRLNPTISGLL